jgi:hypothetical protein
MHSEIRRLRHQHAAVGRLDVHALPSADELARQRCQICRADCACGHRGLRGLRTDRRLAADQQ